MREQVDLVDASSSSFYHVAVGIFDVRDHTLPVVLNGQTLKEVGEEDGDEQTRLEAEEGDEAPTDHFAFVVKSP